MIGHTDTSASAWITFQAVSQQYAAFKHQDKYVIADPADLAGKKIYTMTADAPEGPWENLTEIYSTPLPFPDMFTYNAWAHPQFNEDNELLVSYNSNGDFWEIFNNVELYRPTFVRVPFEMIDSSFILTDIMQSPSVLDENIVLHQNYPNPVLDLTTISFELKKKAFIILEIYNSEGIRIASLINTELDAGKHQLKIDLHSYSPGLYFYRIGNLSKKMIKLENY